MSKLEKDGLKDCLFSRQDRKLVNIKFMRGSANTIPSDDLRTAICSIVQQRDAGQPSGPAKSRKPATNVRNLVASM